MHKPRRLQPGDTIGIVSTSSPVDAAAVDRMRLYFEQQGYPVKVAPHTLSRFGFMAGLPQERADDFNALVKDPTVRMIVTAMGGASAVHLLPLVDYSALAADPKFVVGLSDPSILLNAITSTANVPTIHGPNGVEFGYDELTPFAEKYFWPMVREDLLLPYVFPVSQEMKVLRGGKPVEGPLYGGNLDRVELLIGTPWAPVWKDSILFLEEFDLKFPRTDRFLMHFKLAGIFDSIKGLIFGKPVESEPVDAETLEDLILRICGDFDFPIIANIRIGHTDDKITVPIGCRVCLDPRETSLSLLESPTC
jgi:muramoyltetrapeptide carboxypeptidase